MKISTHHFRFYSRLFRVGALRLVLHFALLICRLEDWWRKPTPHDGKRVLVIVFGGLGDCLLFDPLFRRMKEQWPGARVDVLTGCFESMWHGFDSIDHLIFFGRNTFKPPWAYFALFRKIYRTRYDIAVEGLAMMPKRGVWSMMTSLMLYASQAPLRVGRPTTGHLVFLPNRQHGDGFLGIGDKKDRPRGTTALHASINRIIELPLPQERFHHEAHYVAQAIGIEFSRHPDEPRLHPDPVAELWARAQRRQAFGDSDVVVGLVVETTYALKRWPVERFREVIERGARDGMKFILLGHSEQVPALDGQFPPDVLLNLSGKTTLAQMIALIGECDLFLGADTGPAHVAQACGVPTVVLFGPSNDGEFGPVDRATHTLITPTEDLPCRPCVLGPCVLGHTCMNFLTADRVYAALLAKFQGIRPSRAPRLAATASAHSGPRVLFTV